MDLRSIETFEKIVKRALDIVGALGGLLLLAPVMVVVGLLVRWKMGRPVLFRQERPGLNGKPFEMFKFRTMLGTVDGSGNLLSDAERLTKLGKFLRSTSLDELPGLWNVLRGDMSLVGPRPLLMEYLPLYNDRQKRRHEVKPGITGWAQVNGRNSLSWNEKFELDSWYVDNQNLWLDIRILFSTILKVLRRSGISAEGHVTQEKFKGRSEG